MPVEHLAKTLVTDHRLATMFTSVRRARRGLTTPGRLEAPPVPHSFTLGPADVRNIGLTHARRPLLALRPTQLGPAAAPALHHPLGDGTDAAEAWTALRQLTRHLKQA